MATDPLQHVPQVEESSVFWELDGEAGSREAISHTHQLINLIDLRNGADIAEEKSNKNKSKLRCFGGFKQHKKKPTSEFTYKSLINISIKRSVCIFKYAYIMFL